MAEFYYIPPRHKYRLMILNSIEKAIQLNVQGDAKAFWRQVRSVIMLLSRYMPSEVRSEVSKIVEKVKEEENKVKNDSSLSTREKEAKLNELYQEYAQDLLDYLTWVVVHSPIVGMDVEGALFVDVENIEDLRKIGEKIKNLKMEVEMNEGSFTTSED